MARQGHKMAWSPAGSWWQESGKQKNMSAEFRRREGGKLAHNSFEWGKISNIKGCLWMWVCLRVFENVWEWCQYRVSACTVHTHLGWLVLSSHFPTLPLSHSICIRESAHSHPYTGSPPHLPFLSNHPLPHIILLLILLLVLSLHISIAIAAQFCSTNNGKSFSSESMTHNSIWI